MTLLKEGISQPVLFVMPGHSWWEVHIPSLINIANKWVTEVCCDDTEVVTGLHWWHAVTGRQWGVVTLAPSPDMHRWCPHDMSMISVQLSVRRHTLPMWLPVWLRREHIQAQECHEGRYFSPHVELWESLFPCDILCSRCSEYVTFHVDCTGVHTACTPCVHVYTPSRTIHSVVRRPQRGPHRWSSLRENKWNNEIRPLLQLTGLITVKISNLSVIVRCDQYWVKWQDRLDSDMCQHLTNIIS